jgi:tetratricopeptide (TPR) repeat protein
MQQKNFTKAIQTYERALARQPKFWVAANDLAFLLSENATSGRDLDRALDLANKALALQPDNATILDTIGWVYYKKGNTGKSVDYIGRVQAKYPNSPVINYHMGMALFKSGKRDKAKEFLRKALDSKEDFTGREEAARTLKNL